MQFKAALQVLSDAFVDFVVIGGMAATFHGSARVTYDWISAMPEPLKIYGVSPKHFPPFTRDRGIFRPGFHFNKETGKLLREALATLTVPTIHKILLEERVFTATPESSSSPTQPIRRQRLLRRLVSRLTGT